MQGEVIDGVWVNKPKPKEVEIKYNKSFEVVDSMDETIAYIKGNNYFVRRGTTLPERDDDIKDLAFLKVDKEIFSLYEEYITKGSYFAYKSADALIMQKGY